jgi:hypothetical protein
MVQNKAEAPVSHVLISRSCTHEKGIALKSEVLDEVDGSVTMQTFSST